VDSPLVLAYEKRTKKVGIDQWACVVRLGGVGDNLMASSILSLLKQQGFMVEFIAQKPHHEVLVNNPYIDKLTVKESGDFPAGGGKDWFDWFKGRAKEYGYFINLSHTCETTLACVAGQSQFYWPAPWRRRYCGHNYLEFIHDVAGLPHVFDPHFYPTEEEFEKALDTKGKVGGERVIGWCLSGTRVDKVYPSSPMVVARIIKELGCSVILLGAPGIQGDMAKTICEHVEKQNGSGDGVHVAIAADYDLSSEEDRVRLGLKPGIINWPLRRVLSQALTCDLVVSPDTGVAWAVAMADMPKIMLLSHASPKNITKHWKNTVTLHADNHRVPCYPCHMLHDDKESCQAEQIRHGMKPNEHASSCIADISVETIVSEAKRLLCR
jgi:ADP-heptose:LPS heptosyltransferase